jgi:hypothetical protein
MATDILVMAIVLLTLSIGWIVVWKCVLSKMPFIQELFDLKPTKKDHEQHSKKDKTNSKPSISFEDRYQLYRKVLCLCYIILMFCKCQLIIFVIYRNVLQNNRLFNYLS